jgi:hypothetical protein
LAQIINALVGLGIGLENIEHHPLGSDDDLMATEIKYIVRTG